MNFQRLHTATAAAAALFLAACGGGGGSSSGGTSVTVPTGARTVAATASADLSTVNAVGYGGSLVRAVLNGSGNGLLDITGAGRESPAARSGSAAARGPVHGLWVASSLKRAPWATSGREQPGAVTTDTQPCLNGGTLTITVNDADNNLKLNGGDTLSVTANNCVIDVGLPLANGSFSMTVNAVELDVQNVPTALDVSARFTAFAVAGQGTIDGNFRLWTKAEGSVERFRLSYLGATVAEASQTVVYDFDFYGTGDATGGVFELSGGLRIAGQTYAVVTTDVFSFTGANPPGVGSAQLRDAAGDAVRIIARSPSTLDLEFFPSGAGTPTLAQIGVTWASFETGP